MTPRILSAVVTLCAFAATPLARAADAAPTSAQGTAVAPAAGTPTPKDPARAKVLFDEAVELARGGKFPEACQKLEESQRLHDGLGTAFHLAGCWQKIGRTASAYALFATVATRADEASQAERAALARERMQALGPKLSRLRIDLTEPAPQTQVYRDDVLVPESDWGKPIPVDRGSHELRVTAEGKKPWKNQVDVNEPSMTIAVAVPALASEPSKVAAVVPVAKPKAKAKPEPKPEPAAEPPSSGSGARTRAVVLGGVGAAALAFGIFESAQYADKNKEAESICPSGVNCTEQEIAAHQAAVDDAKQARTWAFIGVGVGGAAVAVATYLFFSAPHGSPPSDQKRSARLFNVEPVFDGRGKFGAALSGRF